MDWRTHELKCCCERDATERALKHKGCRRGHRLWRGVRARMFYSAQEVMGQERVETYDLDVESYGSGSDDFGQNPRKWT